MGEQAQKQFRQSSFIRKLKRFFLNGISLVPLSLLLPHQDSYTKEGLVYINRNNTVENGPLLFKILVYTHRKHFV